jgi:hypothetical protein
MAPLLSFKPATIPSTVVQQPGLQGIERAAPQIPHRREIGSFGRDARLLTRDRRQEPAPVPFKVHPLLRGVPRTAHPAALQYSNPAWQPRVALAWGLSLTNESFNQRLSFGDRSTSARLIAGRQTVPPGSYYLGADDLNRTPRRVHNAASSVDPISPGAKLALVVAIRTMATNTREVRHAPRLAEKGH